MYNMLLVDDETIILEGLSQNINWQDLDIQEVFTADNSLNAQECLCSHRIDLVITDIQMPGENGLALGETILQKCPYTKVIILSGYQNFSYAQQAVQIKAFRYLLKPVRYEDLEKVVREALHELQHELQGKKALENAKKLASQAYPLIRQNYLMNWLEKDAVHPWENLQEADEHGLCLTPAGQGYFIMIRLGQREESASQDELLHYAMLNLCQDMLEGQIVDFINAQQTHCFLFLTDVHGTFASSLSSFQRAIERLDWVLCSLENMTEGPIRIFWSKIHPLEELGTCYREMSRKALRFIGSSQNLVCSLENSERPVSAWEPSTLHSHPSFPTLIATGRALAALEWIDKTFEELSSHSGNCHDQCLYVYHMVVGTLIADSFQRQIGILAWGGESLEFMEEMGEDIVEDLRSQCKKLTSSYLENLNHALNGQEDWLIGQIKQYIANNIEDKLSITSLAAHFCYNATYLSRVFKAKTDVQLANYIVASKIAKAEELLRAGRSPTDTAAAIGYETYSHFSRTFKRQVGVSPKQYQDERCCFRKNGTNGASK